MSRNALILEKAGPETAPLPAVQSVPRTGEFTELVRRLFRNHLVLAVVGVGPRSRSEEACRGIAAELAASGKRVVIVRVDAFLLANTIPSLTARVPGRVPGVWTWPSSADASVEFFPAPVARPAESDWLASLRRDFDSVLLDCPAPEVAPASADVAVLADAAVLVIESGETAKQPIRRSQRLLELRGVQLAGCILMQRR